MIAIGRNCGRTAGLLASAAAIVAVAPPVGAKPAPSRQAQSETAPRCPALSSWTVRQNERPAHLPIVNTVQIDPAGTLYWNGSTISAATLEQYMSLVGMMTPTPRIDFEFDPKAPCADVAKVAALIAAAVDCTRLCQYRVVGWHEPRRVSPPAPPAPPSRFRPVTGTSPQFTPPPPALGAAAELPAGRWLTAADVPAGPRTAAAVRQSLRDGPSKVGIVRAAHRLRPPTASNFGAFEPAALRTGRLDVILGASSLLPE